MKRKCELLDLVMASTALVRADAGFLSLSRQDGRHVVAQIGILPDLSRVSDLEIEVTGAISEHLLRQTRFGRPPWSYNHMIILPVPAGGQVCHLHLLGRTGPKQVRGEIREALYALIRQISRTLARNTGSPDLLPDSSQDVQVSANLPSIESLPGIGTFEIRFGSRQITLSSELARLTGMPESGTNSIVTFQRCMPVPDTDLLHFSDGTSETLLLAETDFAVRSLTDQAQYWVRRRAEIEADPYGRPWRLIGTLEDITRDRVATNRLLAMVMLGEALRQAGSEDAAYGAAASALGEGLGVDRAGCARFGSEQDDSFSVCPDWIGSTLPSASGVYRQTDHEVVLKILRQGLVFATHDTHLNPWLPCLEDKLGSGGTAVDRIRAQLIVPVLANGQLTHCLYVQSCVPRDWTEQEIAFLRALADRAQAEADTISGRVRQQTLHQELAHRLKNTLALVHALANQSLRGVENRDAVKAFEKRLVALGSAHDLLIRGAWKSGDLRTLAQDVLSRIAPIDRIRFEGKPVSLGPNTATTFGLMLHELGTNAAKYGALSDDTGVVTLRWAFNDNGERPMLAIEWIESDGPIVRTPGAKGFGSRLLHVGFGHQGKATILYPETGCEACFTIPLRQAQEN